ncbi:MAG: polyphosphate polymerase domain-containing protein [Firmicutes bacterium]|nr:polyphosphate polymerase domain-containing protein [Bacillota bacterium]
MDYRHEWKHVINRSDLLVLRQRLRAVAKLDPNAPKGKYWIRSLYFDNLKDKALMEKINGVNCREKFRIRYYNGDTDFIQLEKKSRRSGLGQKHKCRISAEEVQQILDGNLDWMMDSERSLIQELYSKILSQGLRPKTIVDYIREPYVYEPGNVRVTLDYDLRTSLHGKGFLDPGCVTIPVQEDPILLEVKWDEFLPAVIRNAVQLSGRRTAPFSKYAACRIYG